jgi:hypothetical protein
MAVPPFSAGPCRSATCEVRDAVGPPGITGQFDRLEASQKSDLLDGFLLFDQASNLFLDAFVMDRLYLGNRKMVLVRLSFPLEDKAGYQCIPTPAGAAAARVKGGVSHHIKDLPAVERKTDFSDEEVGSTDGSDLAV